MEISASSVRLSRATQSATSRMEFKMVVNSATITTTTTAPTTEAATGIRLSAIVTDIPAVVTATVTGIPATVVSSATGSQSTVCHPKSNHSAILSQLPRLLASTLSTAIHGVLMSPRSAKLSHTLSANN